MYLTYGVRPALNADFAACGAKTLGEDLQQVRSGNQPDAHAAIRNLVSGAFCRAGFANIAHARCHYGRDDYLILPFMDIPGKRTPRTPGRITQTCRGRGASHAKFESNS